ncbi:hypothetical protein RhiJN_24177 [Ceratobasidium sp. AG-Ba]|nr:hypothetical protein RhiJN_24177 [Ceratobasidium sp. AG-Ba]
MFFAKSIIVLAAFATTVLGHAQVLPPMGINGTPKRSDTQRPSNAKPCGNIALSKIDSSKTIAMNGNTFNADATNFNKAKDGSMQFTATFDATGTGKGFKAATITKNGDPAPKAVGQTSQLSVSLPAGTKCTGGKNKDLCLVSFKSASGFGNCVVVKQAGAGAASTKATGKSKATRSRHPRNFAPSEEKRVYAKRAIEWIWAPTA